MSTTSVERAFSFFQEEHSAFNIARRGSTNSEEALKLAAQAMSWACSLDELLTKASKVAYPDSANHGTPYELERNAHQCMLGVKYARNRSLHQCQDLLVLSGGIAFPMEFPAPFWEFVWKASADLPKPDPGHKNTALEMGYTAHLVGIPVRFTLAALAEFFKSVGPL